MRRETTYSIIVKKIVKFFLHIMIVTINQKLPQK
jgi:hypothetical protein